MIILWDTGGRSGDHRTDSLKIPGRLLSKGSTGRTRALYLRAADRWTARKPVQPIAGAALRC
jgi:hypothetical protein